MDNGCVFRKNKKQRREQKPLAYSQRRVAYVRVDNIMIIIYTFSSSLPCCHPKLNIEREGWTLEGWMTNYLIFKV